MMPGDIQREMTMLSHHSAPVEVSESTIHILQGSKQSTIAVVGRVTVDSSPQLRSMLLDLLRRGKATLVVIDLSGVSYVDMSGIAILFEALKAARERSITLHLAGMSGQVRTLAEIVQIDKIFHAWGSEVEFR
jgi:anti-sigma B factor antagonist